GWAVVGESTFGAPAFARVVLQVAGDARPGRAYAGSVRSGQAVAITTGAPVPDGADTVVMAEHTEELSGPGGRQVRISEPVAPGKHVGQVGEDVPAGTTAA